MSSQSVEFVAEVSSNHGCDLDRCQRFIEVSADIGCGAVKFQQFKIRQLFAPEALRSNPALLEREAWELPESFNAELSAQAHDLGLKFSSTPFYRDAVDLLADHVDFFKLASYQVPWLDLLRQVAQVGKPVVLSVGMATLEEIDRAVETLQCSGCQDLQLLHCVSNYPTKPEHANLAAIDTLRARYDLPTGWSDHTVTPSVVERAVDRFDATLIEFHLDLDEQGEEFSSGHCWLPDAIGSVIRRAKSGSIRETVDLADGDGQVGPRPSEAHERLWRSDPSDGLRPCLEERARLSS
ncbi:MAG: sialic acid synthase SpsE [Planctomycetota bacterium]|jgi:sialic acid synthase SpsE